MKRWDWIAIMVIVAVGCWLRLHQIGSNPGWYADEGTHLDIARHAINGQIRYFAIGDSLVLFSRLPLFGWLLRGASMGSPPDMMRLRLLSAALGIITTILCGITVHNFTRSRWLPLLATATCALYPNAILYSRLGFSYNLLAPLVLLIAAGLVGYWLDHGRKWLAFAAVALSLALLTEIWAITLLPTFGLIILVKRWHDGVWALPLALLLPFCWFGWMALTVPDALWFDLQFAFGRTQSPPIAQQLSILLENIGHHWRDPVFTVGVIGLFLLPKGWRIVCPLLFLGCYVGVGRSLPLFQLSYYYMIPLLPLLALGFAAVFAKLFDLLPHWLMVAIVLCITLFSLNQTAQHVTTYWPNNIEPFLINAESAEATAAYVAQIQTDTDVILAEPGIAWMFDGRVISPQFAAAYEQQPVPHIPTDLPRDRWLFPAGWDDATIAIVTSDWRIWSAAHVPGASTVFDDPNWGIVQTFDQITVYQKR